MKIQEEMNISQEDSDEDSMIESDDFMIEEDTDKIKDNSLEQEDDDDLIEESNDDESMDNSEEDTNTGNSAWADAMCRVLNTNVSKGKKFILSKAKKDTDVKLKDKSKEIELVDDSGNVLNLTKIEKSPKQKSLKKKRSEMIEKQKQVYFFHFIA